MSGAARHILDFLRYLRHRGAQHSQDAATAGELSWLGRPGIRLPAGLELAWLGTSGFRISYAGHTVLIDPYLSRMSLGDLLRRRVVRPSESLARRFVAGADAILIGHTHFDHALDTPLLAELFDAKVYGSRSAARLMALYGAGQRAVEVEPYRVYEVGPFEITFVPSRHSKLSLGYAVPADGDISCEHLDDLVPYAYCCGQVFGIHLRVAGVTFYHHGSADLVDDAIRHKEVDYFLAGIAGRRYSERYTERMLRRLEPRVVVPHHYDDFFRPLDGPLGFSPNVDLTGFVADVERVSRDFDVRTLPPLQVVRG